MTTQRTRPEILHLASAAWISQAIGVVAQLGVADLLADGPRTIADLAEQTATNPNALYRVLRTLDGAGVFRLRDSQTVELTPAAEPLRTEHPDSVRMFTILMNQELYEAFGDLMYSMHTGTPGFHKRFGMSLFEYLEARPDTAAMFHRGMHEWGRWDADDILDNYPFSRFRRVVDVGGGNGMFLSALLSRHPHLAGVLLDRPTAIQAAREGMGGPLPGCELVAGDFLAEVPEGGDLYVLKHVLVDWPDEQAVTILSNCRAAMAAGARVLVLDSVIESGNGQSLSNRLDLLMMVVTGGRFRSTAEFSMLLDQAGLRLDRTVPISESITILEAIAA